MPVIASEITIEGNGSTIERDSGAPRFRIMAVNAAGNLTLNDSTITEGRVNKIIDGNGGGLLNDGGMVTLTNSTMSKNRAYYYGHGGGFFNDGGTVILSESTITGNAAGLGGGFFNLGGEITLTHSTVSENDASYGIHYTGGGGGFQNHSGMVTLTHSTVSGNSADWSGGGFFNNGGTVTLAHSTVSGNSATWDGGGFYTDGDTVTLTHSTVSGNSANLGGGVHTDSRLILSHSVITGNTASGAFGFPGHEIHGGPITDGYNVLGHDGLNSADAFPGFTPGASDVTTTSDGTLPTALTDILDPILADNGGPTLTHALVTGSPALDLIPVNNPDCMGTDQRGISRPQGAGCDSGAVEIQSNEPHQAIVRATQDSFIRPQAKSANQGAHPRLDLSENHRLVVGFDLSSVDPAEITRATLVLTIDDAIPPDGMGDNGALVDILRLLEPWDEGNRIPGGVPEAEKQRGSGAGVTWACASDADISNSAKDCDDTWDGGTFASPPSDIVRHTNGMTGEVEFDVTADVQAGADSWLLKKRGQGRIGYYSKDHPDVSTDLNLAPRIEIELQ